MKFLPLVYIAGKLNDTGLNYTENIRTMCWWGNQVESLGANAHIPGEDIVRVLVNGGYTYDQVFSSSQNILSRCDAVYFCPNWKDSKGSKRERKLAKKLKIPCFFNLKDMQDFINEYKG